MGLNALWWWIDRWRKSTAYTDMTLEEQGAYRNLLDEANLRGGAIPNDESTLAKACGDPRRWKKVRTKLLSRFELTDEGWRHPTLDQVLAKAEELQARRSEAGRMGNQVRWGIANPSQTVSQNPSQTHRKAIANPIAKGIANGVAKPSHLSIGDSDVHKQNAFSSTGGVGGKPDEAPDPTLETRAFRFIERYAALFTAHRRGAPYHGQPIPDFEEALRLVAKWDDARLEALVTAFLTTDDPYCRGGSGSIKHFGSRASWCDDKLRAARL